MPTVAAKVGRFKGRYGAAAAFVVLALVGGLAIENSATGQANQLYKTQLQTCERGNLLRQESNRRIGSHEADTAVLRQFLKAGEEARLANYRSTHLKADLTAAHEYGHLITVLDKKVVFKPVTIVNCQKVIKKP